MSFRHRSVRSSFPSYMLPSHPLPEHKSHQSVHVVQIRSFRTLLDFLPLCVVSASTLKPPERSACLPFENILPFWVNFANFLTDEERHLQTLHSSSLSIAENVPGSRRDAKCTQPAVCNLCHVTCAWARSLALGCLVVQQHCDACESRICRAHMQRCEFG